MRAAAAKPGRARAGVDLCIGQGALLGVNHRQPLLHARHDVVGHAQLGQPLGNGFGDEGGRQVGLGPQQPVFARIGP